MLLAYMPSSGTGVASPKYIETRVSVPFAAVDAKAKRRDVRIAAGIHRDLERVGPVATFHGQRLGTRAHPRCNLATGRVIVEIEYLGRPK